MNLKRTVSLVLLCGLLLTGCGKKNNAADTPAEATAAEKETVWLTTERHYRKSETDFQDVVCTYDQRGNRLTMTITDIGGIYSDTTYTYDENDLLISDETVWYRQGSTTQYQTHNYAYNERALICLVTITDNGNRTTRTEVTENYNPDGSIAERITVQDGVQILQEIYTYDAQGLLVDSTSITQTITQTYTYTNITDTAGYPRLVVTYMNGEEISRKETLYNQSGQLLNFTTYESGEEQEQVRYSYDGNGRLVREEYIAPGRALVTCEHLYDQNGNHTQTTRKEGSVVVRTDVLTYDENNCLLLQVSYDGRNAVRWQESYSYTSVTVSSERAAELRAIQAQS